VAVPQNNILIFFVGQQPTSFLMQPGFGEAARYVPVAPTVEIAGRNPMRVVLDLADFYAIVSAGTSDLTIFWTISPAIP
jgi:hypothetical protein